MTNSPFVRSSLAQAALEYISPLIRGTLIEQNDFREEYGFSAEAVIKFGDPSVSIQRSKLFGAIRKVLADQSEVAVNDENGRDWKVFLEGGERERPTILISSNEHRYSLPDFTAMSPDRGTRLCSLEESASDVNLPPKTTIAWRDILSERALEDEEVEPFHQEFRDTPVQVSQSIRAEIQKGQSRVSSLVPPSVKYFDRLVGEYDESSSIRVFAAGPGKSFIERLLGWRSYDGFLSSLLLSSHSALTAVINVEELKDKDLNRAFEFLVERGDRLSQLGGVEVGLRILPERPEIEPFLVSLVEQIRDDDVESVTSGFRLLSALFVLVDGELSRSRLLSDVPPFYRRLASLAQAALIQRETVDSPVEINSFCEWALNQYGEQFYFQSLGDMRLEPRWDPDFYAASQLKAEFFGRLIIAAKNFEQNITKGESQDLLLGSESGSLLSQVEFPRPYYPGPLEGEEVSSNALPGDLVGTVEAQLKTEEVGPPSFVALVNSALIFRVDQSQAELAAEALKVGKHRLANVEDRSQFLAVLNGLATVAAVSRGEVLADELRILVRRYRRDTQYALTIQEALKICLVASASRPDLMDWRDNVGEWLTELAFEDFQDTEGATLYSHIQCLCHAFPELWVSCGKADAALAAYTAR